MREVRRRRRHRHFPGRRLGRGRTVDRLEHVRLVPARVSAGSAPPAHRERHRPGVCYARGASCEARVGFVFYFLGFYVIMLFLNV